MTSIPTTQNTPAAPYDAKTAAVEVARLLSDDRCSDVTLLDVRGISSVQDFVVLASGTSDRQMRSAAADIKNLLPKLGSSVYRTSIDDQSTWIVVDCVDTVVHIFEPNTRSYYDLESMWGDAPKIEWLRPGQKPFTAGDETDEPASSRPAHARSSRDEEGDTDEPTPAATESSEPDADADIELTTGTAEAFVEEARASVASKTKSKPKPKAAAKSKPAPKAKATKKVAKKAPAKKAAAAKKPVPAAKKATKKPAAKAAKKTAPAKKPAAKKATKKAAKKR